MSSSRYVTAYLPRVDDNGQFLYSEVQETNHPEEQIEPELLYSFFLCEVWYIGSETAPDEFGNLIIATIMLVRVCEDNRILKIDPIETKAEGPRQAKFEASSDEDFNEEEMY